MTRLPLAAITLLFMLSAASAGAGTMRTVTLNDGSTITGEVVSLANGVYEVRSPTLGSVHIKDSDVRGIDDAPAAAAAPISSSEVEALQQRLLADDNAMDKIRHLKDDPLFRKVLNDPEVLRALKSGDVSSLLSNPSVNQLANHPVVKDLGRSLGQ